MSSIPLHERHGGGLGIHPLRTLIPRSLDWIRQKTLYLKKLQPLPQWTCEKSMVVVSLASYPQRFPTLPTVLRSLLFQSAPPHRILVWLDCQTDELPDYLQSFSQYGIDFRFVEPGLRSHKKWFNALQEFSDSIVITVDDDIAYPFRLVESLLSAHCEYSESVCALRCHRITKGPDGITKPYGEWYKESKEDIKGSSHELFATGCWGILYPPHVFGDNPYAFDKDLFLRLAPLADDIWLKFMELVSNRTVYWKRSRFQMFEMEGTQTHALAKINCFDDHTGLSGNDRAIANLRQFFRFNSQCSKIFTERGDTRSLNN